MKQQWHIRKAVAEDSIGLQTCMEAAYASYQYRLGGKRLPPMDLDYASEIRDFPTWVVESETKIVGGLTMVFSSEYASLSNIAVHPGFQGQGLGGSLMRFAESQALENNNLLMHLATHVLLSENMSLYRHLGWKEYSRDKDRVFMQKTISPIQNR